MPSTIGVEPFGTSVADVAALVPEASIPETRGAGQKAVIESDVEEWITRLSAEASVALDGWTLLPLVRKDFVSATARNLVAQAAASYLEAARAPERASKADTSYAAVLWDRWTSGMTSLTTMVLKWLETDPVTAHSRPAAQFPPVTIHDRKAW